MTDYIGDTLLPKVILVTKGADRKFTVRRKDVAGNPVNWNAAVYLYIDIDKTAPTQIAAVVTNEMADIRIESAICDQVKGGRSATTWRVIMSEAGTPTLETPLMVGFFQRQDGPASG